jgi:hypothetical protein
MKTERGTVTLTFSIDEVLVSTLNGKGSNVLKTHNGLLPFDSRTRNFTAPPPLPLFKIKNTRHKFDLNSDKTDI